MSGRRISGFLLTVLAAVLLFIAAVHFRSPARDERPTIIPPPDNPAMLDLSGFTLSWSDEFDGESLDPLKWAGFRCDGDRAVIRQGVWWHTDFATVEEGCLHISTTYHGDDYKGGKPGWYSCGICTNGLFEQTFGYFEIRCILPKGEGLWSAFWLSPEDFSHTVGNGGLDGAELDVMESPNYRYKLSNDVNVVTSNIHIDGYDKEERSICVATPFIPATDPYEEFTTYGIEWNQDEYIFFVNGVESGRSSFGRTSRVPEYLLLTVEVGGSRGVAGASWAGRALVRDSEPTDFVVDYVRVYQYNPPSVNE